MKKYKLWLLFDDINGSFGILLYLLVVHRISSANLMQKHTHYLDGLVSLPRIRQGRANWIQPGRAGYLLLEGFDPVSVVCI